MEIVASWGASDATVIIASVATVSINLLTDLTYAAVDRRIAAEGRGAWKMRRWAVSVLLPLLVLAQGIASVNPSAAQTPADRQELTVAFGPDNYRVDPTRSNVGQYPNNVGLYETLVRLSRTYTLEPGLAERWEFIGHNTWRFYLRRGVKFHNAASLTAAAVKGTIDRIARAGGGTVGVTDQSARIVDDYTIDITPRDPNRRVPEQIAHPSWGILAPGTFPGQGTEAANRPTGTGPFRFVEYVRGDHLTVERFDGYWGRAPRLSRITFRFLPDGNARVLSLQSGEVDVIADVPREVANSLGQRPGIRVIRAPVGAYEALYVTIHGKDPYVLGQEQAVRQALALAIDKQAVVRNVWQGNAEVSLTMIPASILGKFARAITGPPYDPARARQLLEEASWSPGPDGIRQKAGRRLSLTMVVGFPSAEIHKPMPELVQAQLREVGVEVKLVTAPDEAAYEARLAAGDGDLWAEIGNQNDGNPCFLPDLLFYSRGVERSDYATLFGPRAKFDRFIEVCRTATEVERLQEAAAAGMHILIDEEYIVIPIAGIFRIWGLRDRVQGFLPHPSSLNQRWDALWVSR
jgi:peptide/nickel transport system substrate-binding protein